MLKLFQLLRNDVLLYSIMSRIQSDTFSNTRLLMHSYRELLKHMLERAFLCDYFCYSKIFARLITNSQEKSLSFRFMQPVPQTDTGGREEYSKVLEWIMAKELGKFTL